MADEELVAELAEVIGRASEAWCGRPNSARPPLHPATEEARAALAWLAERGRLVPDGAQVVEHCGVRWANGAHVANLGGVRASNCADAAEADNAEHVHRQVITGPWVAVDEETT